MVGRPPNLYMEPQAGSQGGAQPWGKVSSSGLDGHVTEVILKTGFFLKVAKPRNCSVLRSHTCFSWKIIKLTLQFQSV